MSSPHWDTSTSRYAVPLAYCVPIFDLLINPNFLSEFFFVGLNSARYTFFSTEGVFLNLPLITFTAFTALESTVNLCILKLSQTKLIRLSQPFMEKYLKIQDTCGIHNLHAMPGVIGGIVGAITAAAATESVYGTEG